MPTFDIVSEVDRQEVRNAVDQAAREVATRYDFKGTNTTIRVGDDEIVCESSTDNRLDAAIGVLKEKLVRRKVSLKALSGGTPKEIGGARYQATFGISSGIAQDAAKELSKVIRDTKIRVQVQVQGNQLRVQGKKRDDLQQVIAAVKDLDYRLPLQYVNFRD
ncbi:MAG: YajQ family cyclic di-GMP-binding protein [Acidimicrobiia bacterium]|jgi:uncharacterized protein YajQ (UPF0234 family)